MTSLTDRYGAYGNIGLVLVEYTEICWTIKLLLIFCRVMAHWVGTILLHYLMQQAKAQGVQLQAEVVSTDRNQRMNITYRFAGFETVAEEGAMQMRQHDLVQFPAFPDYVTVQTPTEKEYKPYVH